jgi:uncharacterized membrane protein (UPF0127 family)
MKKGYVHILDNVFETLLAVSSDDQERGLMGISWPPPVMSFVYDKPKINKFWMHNTPSPLDIIFCKDGKINQICKGEPHSTQIIGKDILSDLVIELPYGTCKILNIKVSDSANLLNSTKKLLKIK